jgi:Protein of unknown function DUF262.
MNKADRTSYSVHDLFEWHETGKLTLTPKFQRRKVWSPKARSSLIDSILLDMPIPPIFIRVIQNEKMDKTVREVIDGQQRLSSVFDFLRNEFSLSKYIEYKAAGKTFVKLSKDDQEKIRNYTFICEVFHGISDNEVLKLFSRLNVYSVKLNEQELRHGQYFGVFKQCIYDEALKYLEFWKRTRIFSDQAIARMLEAEFVSELFILAIDGPQDKKKTISKFYSNYDDEFPDGKKIVAQFENVMSIISETCLGLLPQTEYKRLPLFYALFAAIYHRLYGINRVSSPRGKINKISSEEKRKISNTIVETSNIIEQFRDGNQIPKKYNIFVVACLQQTDNIKPRIIRIETIYSLIFGK